MKKIQDNSPRETAGNETSSSQSKQKQLNEDMMNELRKQGVNVDLDFDTDFEDYIDEHRFYKAQDSYGEYGDDYGDDY